MRHESEGFGVDQMGRLAAELRKALAEMHEHRARANDRTLFKYTDYEGAKKIVGNRSIRLSHPRAFNDPFDMLLTEALGAELEEFLPDLQMAFFEFVSGEIDYTQLRPGPFRDQIILMNCSLRGLPEEKRAEIALEINSESPSAWWDVEAMRETNRQMAVQIEKQFEDWGIFCASRTKDSLLMWAHYADHHKGAVLEFRPNIARDSPLLAAKPVRYSRERPLVYRTAKDLVERSLMLPLQQAVGTILGNIVYTKSPEWEYEEEIRLAIPYFIAKGATHELFRFYPDELTAIYFGCRMSAEQQSLLIKSGKSLNAKMVFYRAVMAKREYRLEWTPV